MHREWATSPQRYAVRVGWRRARVSDNVADLLQLIDGARTLAELAVALGALQGRYVHPAEVQYLIQRRLIPAGLVALKASAPPAARSSQAPTAAHSSRRAAAAPATTAPTRTASQVVSQPAAASLVAELAAGRPALNTAPIDIPLAAPVVAVQPLGADVAVTQPLPEPMEAASPSTAISSGFGAPRLAPALYAPGTDDPPTLPAHLWHALAAPATDAHLTPVVAPSPEPAAPQRALVPAVVAGPPASVSPRGGAPTRTRNEPRARRRRTGVVGHTAVSILGLAFLLGALVAVLSLDGQRPSLAVFQQPPTAPPRHASTATPLRERLLQGERAYVVQPGDTLAGIAGRSGLSAEALLIVNGDVLPQTSALQPGMQLAIPAVYNPQLSPTVQPRPLYYVVKRGDTLYDLGLFFGTTWSAIADYNHLADPRTLTVGQGLLMPPAGP
jgi:LysM repeat protein